MKITQKRILRDYNKIKELAFCEVAAGNWDKACDYIRWAASFMYNCNVVYSDRQLEDAITAIANGIVLHKEEQVSSSDDIRLHRERRIAFYDYFAIDNRGLTEQYIDAFGRLGYNVLFVIRNEESASSHEIFKKIRGNNNFSIYITREGGGASLIREITETLLGYMPTDLLVHTSPWDVEGLCSCQSMAGKCTRYLSNITDHAFWLGVKSFDYFLEFRDYGCNISQRYRGIEADRDIKMPYFPIVNQDIEFAGFPFDMNGKKLVVSGGSIYKIKGSPKFLEIVKHILDHHPDVIFLYLGAGDHKYLQDFSDKNGYEGRFFHFNERKDIYQVIRHSHLYLNTYPKLGGLMTQMACIAGKLPVTLNESNDHFQDISELLVSNEDVSQMQFSDLDSLLQAADNYLNHTEVLEQAGEAVRKIVPSPAMFAKMMSDVIKNHKTELVPSYYDVDTERFAQSYIQQLNVSPSRYRNFFYVRDLKMATQFIPYYCSMLLNRIKTTVGGRS